MSIAVDHRQVVLLKSLRTKNRFYALVSPESGLKNADTVADFPPGLALGIAYPCLEDGLNDFAVIRTTFETIDCYPDDQELRHELMAIVDDARGNLVRRLKELRDLISAGQAHFLGTDLREFKEHVVHMATKGTIRRTLDSMMKVDVFESVAKADVRNGGAQEPMYHYEFLPQHALALTHGEAPRFFIGHLFDDVLDAVLDDSNYTGKVSFDKLVFQKFIAVMFVNYATTDPMFYGTNREDYGVSSDRDMQGTPLYQAVKLALQSVEAGGDAVVQPRQRLEPLAAPPVEPDAAEDDLAALLGEPPSPETAFSGFEQAGHSVEIPFGAAERLLLGPLNRLADAIRLLKTVDHPRAGDIREIAASAGQEMFRNLQELNIISPLSPDPIADAMLE